MTFLFISFSPNFAHDVNQSLQSRGQSSLLWLTGGSLLKEHGRFLLQVVLWENVAMATRFKNRNGSELDEDALICRHWWRWGRLGTLNFLQKLLARFSEHFDVGMGRWELWEIYPPSMYMIGIFFPTSWLRKGQSANEVLFQFSESRCVLWWNERVQLRALVLN